MGQVFEGCPTAMRLPATHGVANAEVDSLNQKTRAVSVRSEHLRTVALAPITLAKSLMELASLFKITYLTIDLRNNGVSSVTH